MESFLVLLFSAGSAAFLSALVAGIRSFAAQERRELDHRYARPMVPLVISERDNLRERAQLEDQLKLLLEEKTAAPLILEAGSRPKPVTLLKSPYAGKIRMSFDYVYGQDVVSTSWDIPADASEEAQAELRSQLETALRADGTGVLVTDKITWGRNPSHRKNYQTITAEVRKFSATI